MAYHIDLLLDDERRSPSTIQIYMVLRVIVITSVAALVLLSFLLFLKWHDVFVQVSSMEQRWQMLSPQEDVLQRVRSDLSGVRNATRQLHDFSQTRMMFGQDLAWLQRGVPAEIQLTSLRIVQAISNPTGTAHAVRSYELRLSGQVSSEEAEKDVNGLLAFMSDAAHTGRIESVVIPPGSFRAAPAHSSIRADREFEILCHYRGRSFE